MSIKMTSLAALVMAMPALGLPVDNTNVITTYANLPRAILPPGQPLCYYVATGPPKRDSFHHYQVTDNFGCGFGGATQDGCSVSKLKSHTFGVEAGLGSFGDIGGLIQFGVAESWTSGETYTCNAGQGQTVCVWVNVAYKVFEATTQGECSRGQSPEEMKVPVADNAGGGYYCVYGDACRAMDQNYWEN